MELETMNKQQLEDFLGTELDQVSDNVYVTKCGTHKIIHRNYISVTDTLSEDLFPGSKKVKVATKRVTSAGAFRYALELTKELMPQFDEWESLIFERTGGRQDYFRRIRSSNYKRKQKFLSGE